MIFDNFSPYIRVAMDNTVLGPWFIAERVLFDYELLYIMEGRIIVTVEDETYDGKPGDIFLFSPKQRHSLRKIGSDTLRQPHLHFDFYYQDDSPLVGVSFKDLQHITEEESHYFRQNIMEQMPVKLSTHLRLQQPGVIERMLFDIINEFEMKLPFYEVKAKGLFIDLWVQLLRENIWHQNPLLISNLQMLNRVKEYIKVNFYTKISLDELSSRFNFSKSYLVRLFTHTFGMSPIQYHQLIRIEKAREMIQFTDEPLTSIADKIGYTSIHSFSRIFKKIDGVSPSYYRRNEAKDEST
ncbi:helix-turn-helix domain-containing protein [Cohnella sp.]|uniref:AraC family transcriptional regulator n=1 Tax=Cohnella sp. TaxID=1883426 RepID=UPI0035684466